MNFLTLPLFKDIILPFVLIFTLVFAILEKSRLLGEDKHQINAIIGFVMAGILITFSTQVEWISQFVIFLVISLMILFVFMLLYGFAYSGKDGFTLGEGYKKLIAGIAFVAVVIATLIITGYSDKAVNFFTSDSIGSSILFIVIIAAAIAAVIFGGKKKD